MLTWMCTVVIALKEPQFLGTLVQGVIASCDSSNVVQSPEVKVGFCVAMVFQLRQEGEEVRGWGIGSQLEKLCTQRKRHTGRSGPELKSISMLWEQWAKIRSMSCGSSSRLRLEAAVPMGHGKRCWAERTWYGTTDIFYCPSAADHQASLLPAKFLSIWAQDHEHIMFFLSPCLKIHLPPYYVLDEDETPLSGMWAGASLLSGWPFHPVLAGSLCSKLVLNVVEVICVPPLHSAWAGILSQSACLGTQNCWCLSGDLNDGRNQTEKSNRKSIIDRGTINTKVIMSSE